MYVLAPWEIKITLPPQGLQRQVQEFELCFLSLGIHWEDSDQEMTRSDILDRVCLVEIGRRVQQEAP